MDWWNKIPWFSQTHAKKHIDPARKEAHRELTNVFDIIQLQGKGGFFGRAFQSGTHSDKMFRSDVGFYGLSVREYAHNQDVLVTVAWCTISAVSKMNVMHCNKFCRLHVPWSYLILAKTERLEVNSKQNQTWMGVCRRNKDFGFDHCHLARCPNLLKLSHIFTHRMWQIPDSVWAKTPGTESLSISSIPISRTYLQ